MKPIEETVATLALGFAIGVMGVIAGDKLVEDEIVIADKEHTRADELISIYKRGVRDALKPTPYRLSLSKSALKSGPTNNLWR
jgi:hypothetical protein